MESEFMLKNTQELSSVSLFSRAPAGTVVLFFIKLLSTLSFGALYSTLALYLIQGLHLRDTLAISIVSTFMVFSYALHLLGGIIGGRYFSYRFLFSISMIVIMLACFLLSKPSIQLFYWGLAAFLTGSGLSVTCVNCMITQLFSATDKRRETAFLWNYSAMNIGFFIAVAFSGFCQEHHAFKSLFLLSGIGNLLAFLIIVLYYRKLADVHTSYSTNTHKIQSSVTGVLIMILVFFTMRFALIYSGVSLFFMICLGAAMGACVIIIAVKRPHASERRKIWAYCILGLASLVFLTLYQLMPISLVLFIQRNVDRHLFNIIVAPQWYQNINSIVIIIGSPVLSYLFQRLRNRGYLISIPLQFSLALMLIGLGFFALPLGIALANPQGLVNSGWVVICYTLLTLGELCMIPVGYAMVGELAPIKLRGFLMGVWLMLTGVATAFSNIFSSEMLGTHNVRNPLLTNLSFSPIFLKMACVSVIAGIVLLLISPWIQRKLIRDEPDV